MAELQGIKRRVSAMLQLQARGGARDVNLRHKETVAAVPPAWLELFAQAERQR